MNTYTKICLISLGGVAGGVVGYLVADLVIYKISKKDSFYDENENSDLEFYKEVSNEYKPKNYNEISKPDLAGLAAPFRDHEVLWRLISQKEYLKNNVFEKSEVLYYENDQVFADEEENKIENPEELFGPTPLSNLGHLSNDPSVVYIRNLARNTDYEITSVDGSYTELVGGEVIEEEIVEEKPKKKKGPNSEGNGN